MYVGLPKLQGKLEHWQHSHFDQVSTCILPITSFTSTTNVSLSTLTPTYYTTLFEYIGLIGPPLCIHQHSILHYSISQTPDTTHPSPPPHHHHLLTIGSRRHWMPHWRILYGQALHQLLNLQQSKRYLWAYICAYIVLYVISGIDLREIVFNFHF